MERKYFGAPNASKLSAMSVGNKEKSLEQNTVILGGYYFFETPQLEKEQEKKIGLYSREN